MFSNNKLGMVVFLKISYCYTVSNTILLHFSKVLLEKGQGHANWRMSITYNFVLKYKNNAPDKLILKGGCKWIIWRSQYLRVDHPNLLKFIILLGLMRGPSSSYLEHCVYQNKNFLEQCMYSYV